jgi:phage gp45-like
LCFDYFVDNDLTGNFSDEIQGNSKATEENVEKKIAEINDLTGNFSDEIQGNSKATEEDVEKKIAEIIKKK